MSLQGLARPSTLNPALFYDCTGRALHKQVLEHSNPQLSMCARVFKKGKGPGGLSATGEGRNISNLLHLIKVALRVCSSDIRDTITKGTGAIGGWDGSGWAGTSGERGSFKPWPLLLLRKQKYAWRKEKSMKVPGRVH
eukprot:1147898-Pelagomonas_calceolata.AAC.4